VQLQLSAVNGAAGWALNRDSLAAYRYSSGPPEPLIGNGMIIVDPVQPPAANKFIAEYFLFALADNIQKITFQANLISKGSKASNTLAYKETYTNLHFNLPGTDPQGFYDCRYTQTLFASHDPPYTDDGVWHEVSLDRNDLQSTGSPPNVVLNQQVQVRTATGFQYPPGTAYVCPGSFAQLPAGSILRMFTVTVGDSSLSDTGVSFALDDITVHYRSGGTINFDIE
jgi:hypothetical protein